LQKRDFYIFTVNALPVAKPEMSKHLKAAPPYGMHKNIKSTPNNFLLPNTANKDIRGTAKIPSHFEQAPG